MYYLLRVRELTDNRIESNRWTGGGVGPGASSGSGYFRVMGLDAWYGLMDHSEKHATFQMLQTNISRPILLPLPHPAHIRGFGIQKRPSPPLASACTVVR